MKLCNRLLTPYVLYSLLYFVYNVTKVAILHKNINLIHNLFGIIIQLRGTDYTMGVWFLPLLFLSEVLIYPLLLQKKQVQISSIMFLLVIGFIYAKQVTFVLPWGLDVVPFSTFFIWTGYQYKEYELVKSRNLSKSCLVLLCMGFLCINIITGTLNVNLIGSNVDMYTMSYDNPLLYLISAFAGVWFVFVLCKGLLDGFEIIPMKFIGQNTLHIYCIHGLIISIIQFVTKSFYQNNSFPLLMKELLITAVTIIICIMFIYFKNKIKCKVLSKYTNLTI